MKIFVGLLFLMAVIQEMPANQSDNIEFVCLKSHKASNTCYFNFKVDGAKYAYVDMGCKKIKKKEETIAKVKEGELALSKDWKIPCPEPKP